MSFINQFAQSVQKYGPQAFSLNYRIAGDPELSGEEYHACAAYVEAFQPGFESGSSGRI